MFTVHCKDALACFKDKPDHFLSLLADHSPLSGGRFSERKNLRSDIMLGEGNVLRLDYSRASVDDVLFSSLPTSLFL